MDTSHRTTVDELRAQLDLPDPTNPVPFERFADLKNSEDMLQRAAFWSFYAAWQNDKQEDPSKISVALSVEARNDAHIFQNMYQQIAIRDCMLIASDELAELVHHRQTYMVTYGTFFLSVGVALALGVVITWLALELF